MKKIVAVTLVLLMTMLLYVPAFAAETGKEQTQSTSFIGPIGSKIPIC